MSKYGSWEVIGEKERIGNKYYFLCRCACGKEKLIEAQNLRRGSTKRCLNCRNHGESGTLLNHRWRGIKDRCLNPNSPGYLWYGGRGISVCKEWAESYQAFSMWAHANGYDEAKEIDRIDTNGNYEPSNCRFVSRKENSRNRRNTNNIEAFGEQKCLTEWADDSRCSVTRKCILHRIKKQGWDAERAISVPAGAI